MRDAFLDVIEFHVAANLPLVDQHPPVLNPNVIDLREDLVTEEFYEFKEALDELREIYSVENLAKVADAIADSIYVLIGTAIVLGVDLPLVWLLVHSSNMAKFGPGSWKRDDGKQMKPPGWEPPDIEGAIKNQKPLIAIYGKDLS